MCADCPGYDWRVANLDNAYNATDQNVTFSWPTTPILSANKTYVGIHGAGDSTNTSPTLGTIGIAVNGIKVRRWLRVSDRGNAVLTVTCGGGWRATQPALLRHKCTYGAYLRCELRACHPAPASSLHVRWVHRTHPPTPTPTPTYPTVTMSAWHSLPSVAIPAYVHA